MKTLLVHLDASPRSALRLDMAQTLARRHEARLTACYAVLPTLLAVPWAVAEGIGAVAATFADVDREQRERAQRTCREAARRGDLRWTETTGEAVLAELVQRALLADVLVLGQTDPADGLAGALPPDLVPSLIVDSGRPALVVPHTGRFDADTGHVLVAWNRSREAARALAAALPWLKRAAVVHLACPPGPDGARDRAALDALRGWMEAHEVRARLDEHDVATADAGNALLSLAADTEANLLVMGCYGHGRAREWVLGGATRTVLQSMTLPVLMAH